LKVKFYTTSNGNCTVIDFIEGLDLKEQGYFLKAIRHCEETPFSSLMSADVLGKMSGYGLYELRIRAKGGVYRILCVINGPVLWLLHAFKKKTQKIKQREIETALNRFKDLKLTREYAYGL
jgi:phage-related protein